jgi:MoaA/NifB/PqqE/SkfB family radical SAM enzyme
LEVDKIRTLKLLTKWSLNRAVGKRRPLVAVFSLTHYCNFYCPMCPFGDSNKEGQLKLVNERDLTTEQWKSIFDKVSKYCVWSIIEGGEPTSRPDFMDLVSYLHSINLPTSLITNCSLLLLVALTQSMTNHIVRYGVYQAKPLTRLWKTSNSLIKVTFLTISTA